MSARATIVRLGNPILRMPSMPIKDVFEPRIAAIREELHETLLSFRKVYGFRRAIAAPQIGHSVRMIAMNLGKGPFTLHNPDITWKSDKTFTLWDDCMSMPDLLVRVERHSSVSVKYMDEQGKDVMWNNLYWDHSELIQHELDHLDGILMLDRAAGIQNSIIYRSEYDKQRKMYDRMVDYVPPAPQFMPLTTPVHLPEAEAELHAA